MAQTPARDFIKDAVVDFRFYGGDDRNYAYNTNALVWSSNDPIIQPAHGVPALAYVDASAPQSWMAAAQTQVTIEALISADMFHLGTGGTDQASFKLLNGDWNVGLYQTSEAGFTSITGLYFAFNADTYLGTNYIHQDLTAAASAISAHRGSPLHIVLSARYTVGGTLTEVATMVNGVYDTANSAVVGHAMVAAPTNALFDSTIFGPTYCVRMWDEYVADELVFADLYREARKILPGSSFAPVAPNKITFVQPA